MESNGDGELSLERVLQKQSFLETYARRQVAHDFTTNEIDQILELHGINGDDFERWQSEDRAFKAQMEAINARRIDRVVELCISNAERVTMNMIRQACGLKNRNSVRAATLIYRIIGLEATQKVVMNVVNQVNASITVKSPEDIAEAKKRSAKLDGLLKAVTARKNLPKIP